MKNMVVIGGLLAAFGLVALVYQGFTYTSHRDVIEVGPFKATVNEKKTIPLPPILGVLALAGGISLILVSRKSA
jgi:hypothetical protein